ncbi:MAG TPA: class I SAM-dependent methyltransferase [Candidatus Limnocylindria bacterium]|nr:class I SAM-dependent methyltransferase [Candidatus Limnocylindria bacterium]
MGGAAGAGWRAAKTRGARGLSDIFAGQGTDEELLAELYDLEHDEITEDLAFYRELARRHRGPVIDLGCGSGRLFRAFVDGGTERIVGVDGAPALLDRAEARRAADPALEAVPVELVHGDVRTVRRSDRFALAVLAGVIAHLEGPEDGVRALDAARRLLRRDGVLVVDLLGPGALPAHDLPLSVDWHRQVGDRRIVRRSALTRRETPEGLRVDYATLTDLVEADGTIARLPASFRLWYPEPTALIGLAAEAGLVAEARYGSHDLDPLDEQSERCIIVLRPGIDRGVE